MSSEPIANTRVAVAEGLGAGSAPTPPPGGGSGGGGKEEDDLQRRLDMLRRD
jgi:charged multivesicular body protein 2A